MTVCQVILVRPVNGGSAARKSISDTGRDSTSPIDLTPTTVKPISSMSVSHHHCSNSFLVVSFATGYMSSYFFGRLLVIYSALPNPRWSRSNVVA